MIRDRVERLRLNRVISIEEILQDIDLDAEGAPPSGGDPEGATDDWSSVDFDVRDLPFTEHFIKLECEKPRRLVREKFVNRSQ